MVHLLSLIWEANMTSPLLSWSVDTKGHLTYISQSALDFFNKIPSETVGRPFEHLTGIPAENWNFDEKKGNLSCIISEGRTVWVKRLPIYDHQQIVGVRFVGSVDDKYTPVLHGSSRIFNLPMNVLLTALCSVIAVCLFGLLLAGNQVVSIASWMGLSVGGALFAYWHHMRSKIVLDLSSSKNRLRLWDLSKIPKSLRDNTLVKQYQRSHLFHLSSQLQNDNQLGLYKTFSKIVEDSSEALVVTDHNLNIIRCNRQFANIFGQSSEYFQGRVLSGLIPFTTVPFNPVSFEMEYDGRKYQTTVNPKIVDGGASYVCFVFDDVTDCRSDEIDLLNFLRDPELGFELRTENTFLEAVQYTMAQTHHTNRQFILKSFEQLDVQPKCLSDLKMKEEFIKTLQKIRGQMKDAAHLSKSLNEQKSLLSDFIPHQSNLLDALVSEVSSSNHKINNLKLKNHGIQDCGKSLEILLQDLSSKTQDQHKRIQDIQSCVNRNQQHLKDLQGEQDGLGLNITMSLENRLTHQNTSNSLLEISQSVDTIQENFNQWDVEATKLLAIITQASESSYFLLQTIGDNVQQINNLMENVESTYDVVDLMCQDQIVHCSIGEYINQGVENLETTLRE